MGKWGNVYDNVPIWAEMIWADSRYLIHAASTFIEFLFNGRTCRKWSKNYVENGREMVEKLCRKMFEKLCRKCSKNYVEISESFERTSNVKRHISHSFDM